MNARDFAVVPAAYVYLRRGDEILLQRRQNTGYMDGTWSAGAAGHIEHGETAAMTACREVAEELGAALNERDLIPMTVMQRTDGTASPVEQRADWFFAASTWEGPLVIREPNKCAEIAWFPLLSLPDAVPPHERLVLDALGHGRLAAFTSFGF